ncbi:MAG: hypothetical protein ACRDSK_05335 [Actinophytocola sp.]|uniref:hypothetical protein n=1 Tax=Actinophytocola sp. TaxID=1872138 RepID=UPI003D6B3DD3
MIRTVRILTIRRALLAAGLAIVAWSATRAVLFLTGNEELLSTGDDPHGYVLIFSMFFLSPVLLLAIVMIVADNIVVWRRDRPAGRAHRIGSGVVLMLSSPTAGPLMIPAVLVGAGIVATALFDKKAGQPRV